MFSHTRSRCPIIVDSYGVQRIHSSTAVCVCPVYVVGESPRVEQSRYQSSCRIPDAMRLAPERLGSYNLHRYGQMPTIFSVYPVQIFQNVRYNGNRYNSNGTPFSADEDSSCQNPVGAWDQCGGEGYDGSTCCIDGYQCEEMAECYSEVHSPP